MHRVIQSRVFIGRLLVSSSISLLKVATSDENSTLTPLDKLQLNRYIQSRSLGGEYRCGFAIEAWLFTSGP